MTARDIPAEIRSEKGAPCVWCNRIAHSLRLAFADDGSVVYICERCQTAISRRNAARRAAARRGQ